MKPGYKTTEFWLTILGVAGSTVTGLAGVIPLTIAAPLAAALTGLYTLGRSIAKSGKAAMPSARLPPGA